MRLAVSGVERAGAPEGRGFNHRARLVITPENVAAHSPFLLMAEDWFAPPAGFPTHPHRGMETVTFVLSGELLHKDHTGGEGRLGAGDAQFMTAGGGVLHSETPGPGGVRSLQLWLNLPARLKRTPARYRDVRAADAPVVRKDGAEARLYAGRLGDSEAPQASIWPLTLIDVALEAGARFEAPVRAGERAFAYMLEGGARHGSDAREAEAGDVVWAGPAGEDATLDILAADRGGRLLFYASPAFDEPIAMGGPFVMNTPDEIAEAFADLRAGRLTEPQ